MKYYEGLLSNGNDTYGTFYVKAPDEWEVDFDRIIDGLHPHSQHWGKGWRDDIRLSATAIPEAEIEEEDIVLDVTHPRLKNVFVQEGWIEECFKRSAVLQVPEEWNEEQIMDYIQSSDEWGDVESWTDRYYDDGDDWTIEDTDEEADIPYKPENEGGTA